MKILLAIDDSKYAEDATEAMERALSAKSADVMVLAVVEPPIISNPPQMAAGYAPEQAERMKELAKSAAERVARAADRLRAAGFSVSKRVVEGEARGGILESAAEWQADLIVVGSHGRKGLRRFLLGSVAESVARHALCSVLIVRTPTSA
ncbi:MAG: universal stress protein [Acidobacteriia bacterium]|nr:universal stress protein [Terriglobia bacterium]